MATVALATSSAVDEDVDLNPLLESLHKIGIEASGQCWDNRRVDWAQYALVVLRSTWDYVARYTEFVQWLEDTERRVPILNPPAVVRWNIDKHYLRDLQQHGLPVVPTNFVEPSALQSVRLPEFTGGIVVKPVIGAGGKDAGCYFSPAKAEQHLAWLLSQGRGAMIQPYLSEIEANGETGLVYFAGEFSHAFRKSALLRAEAPPSTQLFIPEEITPRVAAPDERAVADAVVVAFARHLLYARVDLVRDANESPRILELELTEPSFFVETAPESADRFANAVEHVVKAIPES